jgi:hypothetical protein
MLAAIARATAAVRAVFRGSESDLLLRKVVARCDDFQTANSMRLMEMEYPEAFLSTCLRSLAGLRPAL